MTAWMASSHSRIERGRTISPDGKGGRIDRSYTIESMNPMLVILVLLLACRVWCGPTDKDGRPLIQKLGTVDLDLVETTPVVFKDRLWRFEWVREGYWNN